MGFFKIWGMLVKSEYYNFKYHRKLKLKTIILILAMAILFICNPMFMLIIMGIVFVFTSLGILLISFPERKEYNKSVYKIITKKSYFDILVDKGTLTEYLIWQELNNQNMHKKILINLYIPKENGETAEIDIVLINKYGIYVIESKNYSGWIFGSENSNKWMKMNWGKKYQFYSPINQNRNHIIALANILNIENMNIFKSYVVFSQRCEIKKMEVTKPNIKVIKREQLQETLKDDYEKSIPLLSFEEINELERKLSRYMYPDEKTKKHHNETIRQKYKV